MILRMKLREQCYKVRLYSSMVIIVNNYSSMVMLFFSSAFKNDRKKRWTGLFRPHIVDAPDFPFTWISASSRRTEMLDLNLFQQEKEHPGFLLTLRI